MIKKTMTYTDLFGEERTEDFYFHMFEHELLTLEASEKDGFSAHIKRIVAAQDAKTLLTEFRNILDASFGVRTETGGFLKTPELLAEFRSKQAYSDLYMLLATNEKEAEEFVKGVIPAKLSKPKLSAEEFKKIAERRN